MEEKVWRFGVVANITEYHIGDDGNRYRGTKAFRPGTKIYLAGKDWYSQSKSIDVIGQNRFGKTVVESITVDCIENIRTQRIYKQRILIIIDYLERIEGWLWWNNTVADRKVTDKFVKDWKQRFIQSTDD